MNFGNLPLRKARAELSALSDGRVLRDGQLEFKIFRVKFRAAVGTLPSFFSWKPETVLFFLKEKEKNGFGRGERNGIHFSKRVPRK